MQWIQKYKNTSWIDWVKIILAIDIASAGVGLIFNIKFFHIIAFLFGFFSRFFIGVLYLILALILIKQVLHRRKKEKIREEREMKDSFHQGLAQAKHKMKKIVQEGEKISEQLLEKIDHTLDKGEAFVKQKGREVQEEIKQHIK